MNFALALTSDKIKAVKVDVGQLAGSSSRDSNLALTTLEDSLLAGDVSKQTHDSITAQIDAAAMNGAQQKQDKSGARKPVDAPRAPDLSTIAGLLLGSPEFQRR
jgi:signal recognition particle GTPase